ncbi:MAG: xanthine dehydrogenase accessory protein XdhC [Rhizobiaceae bacterium]|nr:xanthine dehydrogenase accessory protein XdhC [Rhizobiaceae bacterium]
MTTLVNELRAFLDRNPASALVKVESARGSTPREQGAWMAVSPQSIFGTIGGGQLEYMAIDKARQILRLPAGGAPQDISLDIPLGPEIGQCCGGRVELSVRVIDEAIAGQLLTNARAEAEHQPHVYIFGGGHVGHALAEALALLPIRVTVVETRAAELEGLPESIETLLTAVPEASVRDAPSGSAFLVLTHDHALDFLIVAEALKRTDAAYVGMIGSKTKKATFRSWYLNTANGDQERFQRLVSPIGGDEVNDKRPAVIAALASAEVLKALAAFNATSIGTEAPQRRE